MSANKLALIILAAIFGSTVGLGGTALYRQSAIEVTIKEMANDVSKMESGLKAGAAEMNALIQGTIADMRKRLTQLEGPTARSERELDNLKAKVHQMEMDVIRLQRNGAG